MPDKPRAESALCILDCLSGERVVVRKSPFVIGSLPSSDLRLISPSAPQVLCTITHEGGKYEVEAASQVLLNGSPAESFRSVAGEEHSLVGAGCMLVFKHTGKKDAWLGHSVTLLWNVYDLSVHDWTGPFGTVQLRAWVARLAEDARRQLVLVPAGMEEVGFFVRDVRELLGLGGRDRALEDQAWFRRLAAASEKH